MLKWFKKIMHFLIVVIFICVSYLCGCYITQFRQNQKENRSTVTTIAVVNADSGITIDGKLTNYAEELMAFPDVNFTVTGLNDAREGIASDKYAAYILIPSDFSDSVNSINAEPRKAQVTYELNTNLREDVQIKVVNDIHNFMLNLSTNISYIFVDAILREVHAVQDDSSSILANDVSDMESICGINTDDLIEDVEYEALEEGTTEIEYLDLSDDFKTMSDLSDGIYLTYETDMQAAEDALVAITDTASTLTPAVQAAGAALEAVDILTDSEGNQVHKAGMDKLDSYAQDFVQETWDKKEAAKLSLGWKETEEQQETPLDRLNQEIDTQIAILEAFLDQEETGPDTVSGNQAAGGDGNLSGKTVEQVINNLDTLKNDLKTYSENGIQSIDEIPDISWMADEIQTIIDEEIQDKILEECSAESEAVTEALEEMQTRIEEYIQAVGEYDALSYIEEDKIAADMAALQQVLSDMESEIIETDNTYIQYISELDLLTSQNMNDLQESLDTSYQNTRFNIDTIVAQLKADRESLNAQNVALLEGITLKLPYTRLGNLEYTQVYDFIVQPITETDLSNENGGVSKTGSGIKEKPLVYLTIGIIALMVIYVSMLSIHKNYQNTKGKEGEEWLTD